MSHKEIIYVDLFGIENFVSNSPNNSLDVGFACWMTILIFVFKKEDSLETFMERNMEKLFFIYLSSKSLLFLRELTTYCIEVLWFQG